MGDITHGIIKEVALLLKKSYGLSVFVETGTFLGETTAWASKNFSKVYTVEILERYIKGAKSSNCFGLGNIEFFHGESSKLIPEILSKITEPALFWLDAHWGGDLHYKKPEEECPLMGELEAIRNHSITHSVLMIDDARLFVYPPPKPLTPEKWPSFGEILSTLSQMKYVPMVVDDVIICLPRGILNE